jgi:hypothetical protein
MYQSGRARPLYISGSGGASRESPACLTRRVGPVASASPLRRLAVPRDPVQPCWAASQLQRLGADAARLAPAPPSCRDAAGSAPTSNATGPQSSPNAEQPKRTAPLPLSLNSPTHPPCGGFIRHRGWYAIRLVGPAPSPQSKGWGSGSSQPLVDVQTQGVGRIHSRSSLYIDGGGPVKRVMLGIRSYGKGRRPQSGAPLLSVLIHAAAVPVTAAGESLLPLRLGKRRSSLHAAGLAALAAGTGIALAAGVPKDARPLVAAVR